MSADIQLIAARTSEMTPVRRPRDFRISVEQAEQLRGSWLDRLLRGFSTPGWTVVRPLAGAALAIGMALVVVGALPLGNLSGGPAADYVAAPAGNNPSIPTLESFFGQPTVAEPTALTTDAGAPAAPSPAGGVSGAPEANAPSMVPGNDLSTDPPGDIKAGSATEPPPPPEVSSTQEPVPTESSQALGGVPSSPAPDARDEYQSTGEAVITTTSSTSLDQQILMNIGLVLGFLGLLFLGIVWGLRSRYSDPLTR